MTDFKKQHLEDCLFTIEKLFRIVWETQFRNLGLGRLMKKYKTYTLFSLINQI